MVKMCKKRNLFIKITLYQYIKIAKDIVLFKNLTKLVEKKDSKYSYAYSLNKLYKIKLMTIH